MERRNPVGVGFHPHRQSAAIAGLPVPNIESSATSFRRRALGIPLGLRLHRSLPASPAALAGTYDERWRHERAPYLPTGLDAGYSVCAARSAVSAISRWRAYPLA